MPAVPTKTVNFSFSKAGALYDAMIAMTKECGGQETCQVPDVQHVCDVIFNTTLRTPFSRVGQAFAPTQSNFDANTLVYGGSGLLCDFGANDFALGDFKIRGPSDNLERTCDLHCLQVPNARFARIAKQCCAIFSADLDWVAASPPAGPKFTGYSYYHEWLATVEMRTGDSTASAKLITMSPDLEKFFTELMTAMRPVA